MNNKDFVNKEYEARVMVNESQYEHILSRYSKSSKPKEYIKNVNVYFDYDDLYLTTHHIVLRTRNISESEYELTLKIKGEKSDLELNHILTKDEYENMKKKVTIPNSPILEKLNELNVDISRLIMITELRTDRLEVQYKKHLLVIDKNYYGDTVDYNVEVESYSKKAAKRYLMQHVSPFGVEYKNGYIPKSRRAINYFKHQD